METNRSIKAYARRDWGWLDIGTFNDLANALEFYEDASSKTSYAIKLEVISDPVEPEYENSVEEFAHKLDMNFKFISGLSTASRHALYKCLYTGMTVILSFESDEETWADMLAHFDLLLELGLFEDDG